MPRAKNTNFLMVYKIKLLTIVSSLMAIVCISQEGNLDYSSCMEKHLQGTGIDFYNRMKVVEEQMLVMGALSSDDRNGYVDAFQSLIIQKDTKWDGYYSQLRKTVISDFDLESVKLQLLSFCSDIILSNEDTGCNCLNMQKHFLKKLTYKPYDDDEVLDGLLLLTDFNSQTMRHNITYVLLLNMEIKYGR